ncbi:12806_t:CDS:2 [Funneliformis geosporum]|uniref:20090_t:CDS:1 n=1 Tax=Funneliformis geosporum TaxID=1117311 RepID=A0A9W4SQD8_9GLOM|nr:20090_t:CDS:2 [Funneliformis geosporum]CAI2182125.1 12806_t:CDS:2 [Funneliformis geosporum]
MSSLNSDDTTNSDNDPMVILYHNHSYCDWRVTLLCEDGQMYKSLYALNFIIILLIATGCMILLWYRINRQGCSIFFPKIPGTGFIRPNPVEGFLIWVIFWMIGRLLFIIIIWTDSFDNNYMIRESYAWFVIGTYLQIGSHLNSRQRPWRPNSKLTDRYLLLVTIISPITICPITIASGYFRDNTNNREADILLSTKDVLWALWSGFGALGVCYFGKELCHVLRYHINFAKRSNHITIARVERMQTGLEKIKFTLYIILATNLYFIIYYLISSIFRVWIITHSKPLNIFMFLTYAFLTPICIIFVVATISLRTIQSYKKEILLSTKLSKNNTLNSMIEKNININNNKRINSIYSHKRSLSASNNLHSKRSVLTINGTEKQILPTPEIPELYSITSAIAAMDYLIEPNILPFSSSTDYYNMSDQHQFDDFVAYTQFNNDVKLQVEEIGKRESGIGEIDGYQELPSMTNGLTSNITSIMSSGINELDEEKNDHNLLKQPEKVVVRPGSPTIPIYSPNNHNDDNDNGLDQAL